MGWTVSASILVSLLCLGLVAAENPPSKQAPSPKPEKSTRQKEKDEEPLSAEFAVLDRFAGSWNVSEVHYNARGEVAASTKGIEEGAWVLDRRVLRRTYTSGEEGNLFRAIGMITWDAAEKQYQGTWFDNASKNGPTALTGSWDESSKTMTFTLSSAGTDGKPVQHKVIDRFLDDEHRVVTTYKATGNQVEKVIEVQFTRAVPCPGNIAIMPEGIPPTKP